MPINDFRGTHSHDDVFNHVIIRCRSVSVVSDIISTNFRFMNLGIYSIYTLRLFSSYIKKFDEGNVLIANVCK